MKRQEQKTQRGAKNLATGLLARLLAGLLVVEVKEWRDDWMDGWCFKSVTSRNKNKHFMKSLNNENTAKESAGAGINWITETKHGKGRHQSHMSTLLIKYKGRV